MFGRSSGGSPSEDTTLRERRGSPRKFASQRDLRGALRGLCRVSPTVLRGLSEDSAGSAGFSEVFCGPRELLEFLSGLFRGFQPFFVSSYHLERKHYRINSKTNSVM